MAVAAMSIIAAPQTNAKEAENRDAEGNIVYSHTGYSPGSEEELFDKILELKKKK